MLGEREDRVWQEIALWFERGATLAEVEDELIEVPGLNEDERARFGWELGLSALVEAARPHRG